MTFLHPAFLTSLRTNLHLSASSPTSPSSSIPSTPTTPAFSQIPSVPSAWSKPSVWTYSLPESHTTSTISHPTLSVFHQEKAFPASIQSRRQDSPPRLTFTLVPSTDISTRECAHRLIADSVAQQRQLAFRSLLFHPFVLLLFSTFLALGSRVLHTATLLLTASFVITAAILIAHHLTYPYIQYAEDIDRFWLGLPPPSISSTQTNGDTSNHSSTSNSSPSITTNAIPSQKSDEALVLTAHLQVPDKNNKPGNDSNSKEPVAALILRIPKRERRGYVRAWTVQHKHRNKGVGTALLEEAVRVVHARVGGSGARGAVVEFEDRHARTSGPTLPFLLLLLSALNSLSLSHPRITTPLYFLNHSLTSVHLVNDIHQTPNESPIRPSCSAHLLSRIRYPHHYLGSSLHGTATSMLFLIGGMSGRARRSKMP